MSDYWARPLMDAIISSARHCGHTETEKQAMAIVNKYEGGSSYSDVLEEMFGGFWPGKGA